MQPPVMRRKGPWDRAVVTRDFRKMPLWSKTTSGEYLLGVGNISPMDLVKMQILKNPNAYIQSKDGYCVPKTKTVKRIIN